MVITKQRAIEMLKQGSLMLETCWGGYHYTIDNHSIVFSTARQLIVSKQVILDTSKDKSPLLKWYKWRRE